MALEVDTDFADLFEVKDGVVAEREIVCSHDDRHAHAGLRAARASTARSRSPPAAPAAVTPRTASPTRWSSRPASSGRPRFTVSPHAAQPGVAVRATRAARRPRGRCALRSPPSSRRGWRGRRLLQAERPGADAHLPREPQRPRRAADAPRPRRGRDAARGGAAVVHGAVRPRQPDHELPGAALPARAGRDHAARARRSPGRGAR